MKPASALEKRHMERVALMPCLVCGARPVCVHHVVGYADRAGRISKRHDRVTPLCPFHHDVQHGPHSAVHALSHQGFFQEYGIDLMAEAERLWAESEQLERRAA
jgi:hypothetical protein